MTVYCVISLRIDYRHVVSLFDNYGLGQWKDWKRVF